MIGSSRLAAMTVAGALLVAAGALGAIVTTPASQPSSGASAPATAPDVSVWLNSLNAGYQQAQKTGEPILVFAGSDSIAASRRQWADLQSPALAAKLAGWTRVRLADDDLAGQRSLVIVQLPALRILAQDGHPIASRQGPATADELAAWIDQNAPARRAAAPTTNPDDDAVHDALAHLGDSDAVVREAAKRLVAADPSSAAPVQAVLLHGELAEKLSALDILSQWQAPVDGIDPWQPATFTPPRLAALDAWVHARSQAALATTNPATMASSRPSIDAAVAAADIDALLAAPNDIAARAIRERLVASAAVVHPLVAQRLAANPIPAARQRLLALRYRLVATDELAERWPGGFDRIASDDPAVRRGAVAELAAIADPRDHQLLSELFTDDDPFVRESGLRMLRAVGGPDTDQELLRLLGDPKPDVRAAVLKILVDAPDPTLAKDLVHYTTSETDTDLVVQAIRVLQVTDGDDSFNCLLGLLNDSRWRVRGEVADAMLGKISGRESSTVNDTQKATAMAALIARLDDPDGYVVSRAAFTLVKSDLGGATKPLLDAATRRPELASEVLKAVAANSSDALTYISDIRAMTKNEHATVRAAAVVAMATISPTTCGSCVQAALHDSDASVRVAGVRALSAVLANAVAARSQAASESPSSNVFSWLLGTFGGNSTSASLPDWMSGIAPDLQQALSDPQTRVPAAVALCAIGKADDAVPVLNAATTRPSERGDAATALPWLDWEKRLEFFNRLVRDSQGTGLSTYIEQLVAVPDDRAAAPLWNLLGASASDEAFSPVTDGLFIVYLHTRYGSSGNLTADQVQTARTALIDKAKNGTDMQKSAALAVLVSLDKAAVIPVATAAYSDPKAGDWLRLDALQVLLLVEPQEQATTRAVSALADRTARKVAVPFLAYGGDSIRQLRGSVYLYTVDEVNNQALQSGLPIVVDTPAGLDTDPNRDSLKQVAGENDQRLSPAANYLLALIGDRDAAAPLVNAARAANWKDSELNRLSYRALAKLNDDSQVPVLAEIYHGYGSDSYEVREFYWTIRTMTGPNILALRKTIRDDVGMQRLQ